MKYLNNYISEKLQLNKNIKDENSEESINAMITQEICEYLKERNLFDISHIYFANKKILIVIDKLLTDDWKITKYLYKLLTEQGLIPERDGIKHSQYSWSNDPNKKQLTITLYKDNETD